MPKTKLDRLLHVDPVIGLRILAGSKLPPALKRLVEEVRNEQAGTAPLHRYDRIHDRHNRS